MTNGFFTFNAQKQQLICQGIWDVSHLSAIKKEFRTLTLPTQGEFQIDGSSISHMDISGAWWLQKQLNRFAAQGLMVQLNAFSESCHELLILVEKETPTKKEIPKIRIPGWLESVGRFTIKQLDEFCEFLAFVGHLTMEFLRVMRYPQRIRLNSIADTIDLTGFQALPIIALLSFMIGIVISYQMGNQLQKYGANVFIVDLLGLSMLREFGPLLAAIMVAGRTGSSFTAQLGIMKINQEIDALNTMGVTPAELLLIPRLIGLFITLPLLTIWADVFGILGGMVMANNMLNINWHDFLMRFQHEIPLRTLLLGLGKAPVFALLIGSIGCFQGMSVQGSAENLGLRTTRSVVLAIFFIIITDAIFSVLYSKFKL